MNTGAPLSSPRRQAPQRLALAGLAAPGLGAPAAALVQASEAVARVWSPHRPCKRLIVAPLREAGITFDPY